MLKLLRTLLNFRRPPKFRKEDIRSILVIRMNRIGDMICTVPLIKSMKKEFPDARMTVFAETSNADVIKNEPYVDKVLVYKRPAGIFNNRLKTIMNALDGNEFDLAIGVKGGFSSFLAITAALSGARFRVGYVSRKGRLMDRLYNLPVSPVSVGTQHQVDSCLNLLKAIGINNGIKDVSITIPAIFKETARCFMEANGLSFKKGIVIFNISSNRGTSAWSQDKVARFGRLLAEKYKYKCIVSGLPSDEKTAVAICKEIGEAAFYFRTEHIMDFAAITSMCNLLITGDGGASHLGAAAGASVVTLFGAAAPTVWAPYGPQHVSIKASDSDVNSITVEEVMEAIREKGIEAYS
jgi:ADP-heptose:LPS heptosyltransferase